MFELFKLLPIQRQPKSLPSWSKFLELIATRMAEYQKRHLLLAPADSKCMQYVQYVLMNVSTSYLLRKADDPVDLYFALKDELTPIVQATDIYHTHTAKKGVFFKPKGSDITLELWVSTMWLNPIETLPFHLTLSWPMSAQPITILTGDIKQPPLTMVHDQVTLDDPPLTSVVSINLQLLVLKWLAHVKYNLNDGTDDPRVFIHDHIFAPMNQQLIDLWILTLLVALTEIPTVDQIDTLVRTHRPIWMAQGSMRQALVDLLSYIKRIEEKSVDPIDILVSPLLLSGSIMDKVEQYQSQHVFPTLRQYEYLHFFVEQELTSIMLQLYGLSDNNVKDRLKKALTIYLNRMVNSRIPGTTPSSVISDLMTHRLEVIELAL